MRDIKFRALFKPRNEMIYINGFTSYHKGNITIFYNDESETGMKFDFEIMQYTGLKDKNGKEIYEGDIVDTPKGIMKIQYLKDSFQCIEESGYNKRLYDFIYGNCSIIVIGNIYEGIEGVQA